MKHLIIIIIILISINALSQVTNAISFNIRYDNEWDTINNWNNRKESIIDLFLEIQPSFIGIQEGLKNQIDYIDTMLDQHEYIGVGREDGKAKGEYSAIFYDTTEYQLIMDSTFWLSETPKQISVGWDAALERICTLGLFENKESNSRIWIFNTHFDHKGINARSKSVELILKVINNLNTNKHPVLLMGDLNLTPDERPYEIITDYLNDGKTESWYPFFGPEGTFNGFSEDYIEKRIDYIFVSEIKVITYSHLTRRLKNGKHLSDHYPVYITLDMPKRKHQ